MLFLSLVRGSGAKQRAAIFWQLMEMFRLSGELYTELYRAVHRALSAIQNNGVSAFQGEVYTGRVGPIVGTLERVCIIKKSAFQGSTIPPIDITWLAEHFQHDCNICTCQDMLPW